jgi:hypothetical protein
MWNEAEKEKSILTDPASPAGAGVGCSFIIAYGHRPVPKYAAARFASQRN